MSSIYTRPTYPGLKWDQSARLDQLPEKPPHRQRPTPDPPIPPKPRSVHGIPCWGDFQMLYAQDIKSPARLQVIYEQVLAMAIFHRFEEIKRNRDA